MWIYRINCMIGVSLEYIRNVLDQSLMTYFAMEASVVVLNNLVDINGNSPQKNQNKLVVTLVNLEYEVNKQFYGGQRLDAAQVNRINPAVCFNLDILISANFDEYSEALKFLTATIGFFQENISFTRANHPSLPEGISILQFEIENSPSGKTHNLWTSLGAKYLPSIIYKIRHVSVSSEQIKGAFAVIQDASAVAKP